MRDERTHIYMHERTDGQQRSNIPPQPLRRWGHKNSLLNVAKLEANLNFVLFQEELLHIHPRHGLGHSIYTRVTSTDNLGTEFCSF